MFDQCGSPRQLRGRTEAEAGVRSQFQNQGFGLRGGHDLHLGEGDRPTARPLAPPDAKGAVTDLVFPREGSDGAIAAVQLSQKLLTLDGGETLTPPRSVR